MDVVRALLRQGSSVNACDGRRYTALHYAANVDGGRYVNNGEVIRVLLEAGADIEAKTSGYMHGKYAGSTPLHLAVSRRVGSSGTIRALLEAGANVNSLCRGGTTPLHAASFHACVDAVEFLLRWGADEELRDDFGETPVDWLRQWEGYDSEDSQGDDSEESDEDDMFAEIEGVCDEQREADERRISFMLRRAPADRSWRRRGWLVLARSFPAKVQLAHDSCNDASGRSKRTGGPTGMNVQRLVGRVVGLDVESVFRLVVAFL